MIWLCAQSNPCLVSMSESIKIHPPRVWQLQSTAVFIHDWWTFHHLWKVTYLRFYKVHKYYWKRISNYFDVSLSRYTERLQCQIKPRNTGQHQWWSMNWKAALLSWTPEYWHITERKYQLWRLSAWGALIKPQYF